MPYEFSGFVLDPDRRELRLSGREVALQPRVFDVLLYLVERRDRVVPKEELLASVWNDVVVSDGSLKRSVSLVRAALRQGGCEEAIRTYARQGYRFDLADVRETAANDVARLSEPLLQARRAYSEADWTHAATAFAQADASDPLEAPDLERWAEAEQLSGQPIKAISPLERAVAAHSTVGDHRGAARASLALANIHFERMEVSVGKGWLQRARTHLAGSKVEREHGLLAALTSRFAMAEGDLEESVRCGRQAVSIGREQDDIDVELLGRSFLGMSLIAIGEVRAGLSAHEEAAATVLLGTASPLVAGQVYCSLIWTCRNRGDWRRAGEWAEHFTRFCQQSGVQSFAGTCQLHHAEVLHHRGRVDAAEREIHRARELLEELAPYAVGEACRLLGDLRFAQGDVDSAEESYRRAHELGWDPQPGLSLVMKGRGQATAAQRALERSLVAPSWSNLQRRGLLLAAMVEVAIATGDIERAEQALAELEGGLDADATNALTATAHATRAELRAAQGRVEHAITELRVAIDTWNRIGSSLHVARCRMRLAELFLADSDPEAAELELSAARKYVTEVGADNLLREIDRLAGLIDVA